VYAVTALPFSEIGTLWGGSTLTGRPDIPKLAKPQWTNIFRKDKLFSSMVLKNQSDAQRSVEAFSGGANRITYLFSFDYDYGNFPSEISLYLDGIFNEKKPFVSMLWLTPDGREIKLKSMAAESSSFYDFETSVNVRRTLSKSPNMEKWWNFTQIDTTPTFYLLFADPEKDSAQVVRGKYQLQMEVITFEEDSDVNAELILLGHTYGLAGTDYLRRDLIVPLLWGMPFALLIGLVGSVLTTVLSMVLAAASAWFGGWVDDLVQRITEVNLILPILAIAVLAVAFMGVSVWTVLVVIMLLNVFGTPLKSFRAALLQIKDAPYIEAARAYGAGNWRIILHYMVPKIIPVLVPQLIILIPSFVFLEATLGLFNISTGLPTWGTIIYQGLTRGAMFGSRYWVVQPIVLLLLTGFAFSLLGFALEQVLNPRLREK
jgi:peptide/nickel transport system permease protein